MTGPYAGYDSIDEAVEGLRRARLRVLRTFSISHRGFVVEGEILEGVIDKGMVLLPELQRHTNVLTPLAIKAVEFVLHPGGVENVGLVVDAAFPEDQLNLAEGTVVDVLEQSPAPS